MTADKAGEIALVLGPPILTAIVTTALGILGLVVGDWRQRRTQAGRRKLALEDAGRQVAFAKEWLNARKLLTDSPEAAQQATDRAQAWLEEAAALVADSKPPPVDQKSRRSRFVDSCLPTRCNAAPLGSFVSPSFSFFLSLVPYQICSAISAALNPNAYGLQTYEEYFTGDVVAVLSLMLLAMVFRFCAIRTEKPRPAREKRSRVTLRAAFLLYRFHRPDGEIGPHHLLHLGGVVDRVRDRNCRQLQTAL